MTDISDKRREFKVWLDYDDLGGIDEFIAVPAGACANDLCYKELTRIMSVLNTGWNEV